MKNICLGLFLCFLVSCVSGYPVSQDELENTPILTSTEYITPEDTRLISTPTFDWGMIHTQCLEISSARLDESPSASGLVLFDQKDGKAFFWVGASQIFLPTRPDARIVEPEISPDNQHVLYYDVNLTEVNKVVITDATTQIVWSRSVNQDIIHERFSWFDSQRILNTSIDDLSASSQVAWKLILINPFTDSQQELLTHFPEINIGSIDDKPYRWRWPNIIYSPSLTQVIYPGNKDSYDDAGWPIYLVDVETSGVLGALVTQDHWSTTPQWLPDGSAFIIAADTISQDALSYEFYSVSKDGSIKQLTQFHESFGTVEIAGHYTLSPDGHYLAFWLRTQPETSWDSQLVILDLQNGGLSGYCVSGSTYNNSQHIDGYFDPIWSLDSTQLAVLSPDPKMPGNSNLIIIDLVQRTGVRVIGTENVEPIGWILLP